MLIVHSPSPRMYLNKSCFDFALDELWMLGNAFHEINICMQTNDLRPVPLFC